MNTDVQIFAPLLINTLLSLFNTFFIYPLIYISMSLLPSHSKFPFNLLFIGLFIAFPPNSLPISLNNNDNPTFSSHFSLRKSALSYRISVVMVTPEALQMM